MSEYSELPLERSISAGMQGSGFPKGWMSKKNACPVCAKPVAGRHTGMADHIKSAHDMKLKDATKLALKTLSNRNQVPMNPGNLI